VTKEAPKGKGIESGVKQNPPDRDKNLDRGEKTNRAKKEKMGQRVRIAETGKSRHGMRKGRDKSRKTQIGRTSKPRGEIRRPGLRRKGRHKEELRKNRLTRLYLSQATQSEVLRPPLKETTRTRGGGGGISARFYRERPVRLTTGKPCHDQDSKYASEKGRGAPSKWAVFHRKRAGTVLEGSN